MQSEVIIVRVPPERVAWLLRELSSANFPFDTRPDPETGGLAVRAPIGAETIFQSVLGYKRKRRWRFPTKLLIMLLVAVIVGLAVYLTGFDLWVASFLPGASPDAVVVPDINPVGDIVDGVTHAIQWSLSVIVGVIVVVLMFGLVLFGRRKR